MERPLENIIELHSALVELDDVENQLDGIPDWMQELHDEHSARNQEIVATEESIDQTEARRRVAESGIADYQEKLKTFQGQLGQVRNEREYGALLHEIDLCKSQIRGLEEEGLAAMEEQEGHQQRLTTLREAFTDLDGRYAEAQAKWETEKPELARRAEALRERARIAEQKVPAASLAYFRRIRERYSGAALATVGEVPRVGKGQHMWHCGACNYRVRPQVVVEIANDGKMVLCDGCKRILILDAHSS